MAKASILTLQTLVDFLTAINVWGKGENENNGILRFEEKSMFELLFSKTFIFILYRTYIRRQSGFKRTFLDTRYLNLLCRNI